MTFKLTHRSTVFNKIGQGIPEKSSRRYEGVTVKFGIKPGNSSVKRSSSVVRILIRNKFRNKIG